MSTEETMEVLSRGTQGGLAGTEAGTKEVR